MQNVGKAINRIYAKNKPLTLPSPLRGEE